MVEKMFLANSEVEAVTLLNDRVVQVELDFALMTSFTRRKLETTTLMVNRRGYGLAVTPTGDSVIVGLPNLTSPHQVPGPPPGGMGRF
jgi:hypothetical protein